MDNNRKKLLVVAGVFFVAAMAASFLFRAKSKTPPANQPVNAAVSTQVRRRLDGVLVDPAQADLKPYAVMVENHPDARPQSGLSKAQLVWEAPVEGGITRFLAVYDGTEKADEIGPVRSARPYYLDWAKELNAIYLHVGGSPDALTDLPKMKILDLNQFFNAQYFWRATVRQAPHNVYTSSDLLNKAKDDKQWGDSDIQSWLYKDDAALSDRPTSVPDVDINFSAPDFEVLWKYDTQANDYVRSMAGQPHNDKDGSPIIAKNVAVEFTKVVVLDSEGRRQIDTVGEGRALVFFDGQSIDGTWKKTAAENRTRFYDSNGNEIVFNAGSTWIEVVPKGTEVVY